MYTEKNHFCLQKKWIQHIFRKGHVLYIWCQTSQQLWCRAGILSNFSKSLWYRKTPKISMSRWLSWRDVTQSCAMYYKYTQHCMYQIALRVSQCFCNEISCSLKKRASDYKITKTRVFFIYSLDQKYLKEYRFFCSSGFELHHIQFEIKWWILH